MALHENLPTEENELEDDKLSVEETDPRSSKTLKKVLKEDSTLSPGKVVITALTAVSMAVITSKLTTVVNGIALAALIAVTSAIVSEVYRIVTALTAHGVEKAVVPLDRKNAKDKKADEESIEKSSRTKPMDVIHEYFARRKNLQLIALFSTTAILTIGTSFLVAKTLDQPSLVHNNYPTQVKAEQLTEGEKQDLIDKAVSEATNSPSVSDGGGATPTEEPTSSPTDKSDSKEDTKETDNSGTTDDSTDVDELYTKISTLEDRIKELESSNNNEVPKESAPSPEKSTDTSDTSETNVPDDNDDNSGEIDDLRKQIEDLQKEIDDLKKTSPDETPTESSTEKETQNKQQSEEPTSSPTSEPSNSTTPSDSETSSGSSDKGGDD